MGKMPFGRAHVRAGLNDVILVQQRPAQRFSLRTHLAILLAQCGDALRLYSSQWAQYGGVSGFHHVILCSAGWEMMDRLIEPASLPNGRMRPHWRIATGGADRGTKVAVRRS